MALRTLITGVLWLLAFAAAACGDGGVSQPSLTPSAAAPEATEPRLPTRPSGVPTLPGTAATGRWRALAPVPTPRTEVAVAALDGKIYVIGGFEGDGSVSAKVEVYDPATDTWSEAASLPRPRHHAAAAAVGGKLYVIGGFQGGFHDPQSTVFEYDPGRGAWALSSPGVAKVAGEAAVVLDGSVYVVGGVDLMGVNTEAIAVLGRAGAAIQPLSPILTPRDHLAAAATDGKLYAIGGRRFLDFSENLDANEEYDPKTDTWRARAPLPTARSGIAAATLNGRVYVFGGEGPDGTFDQNEVYDPATDSWQAMPPMPTARHGLGAAVVDGTIYAMAGGPTTGLSVSGANEAFTP